MESYPYHRAPEKARERMEGMRASSSSAVSTWSFFKVSTLACRSLRYAKMRRCSESGGTAKGIFSISLCEICGTPLLRPGSIASIKCGDRSQE